MNQHPLPLPVPETRICSTCGKECPVSALTNPWPWHLSRALAQPECPECRGKRAAGAWRAMAPAERSTGGDPKSETPPDEGGVSVNAGTKKEARDE